MLRSAIDEAKAAATVGCDIPSLLESRVKRHPEKPFLIWEPFDGTGDTWSYQRFYNEVLDLAAGLHRRGIKSGDKVLVHMDNCPEFVLAWFACAQLGAVVVTTNTRSVARDMEYFVRHADIVCALVQPQFLQLIIESASKLTFIAVTAKNAEGVSVNHDAETPFSTEVLSFEELLLRKGRAPGRPIDPMADLAIQFTSGTTSRPKAVLWTHANATWGARMNAIHFRLNPNDIAHVFLPLFHTNAQSYSMLGTLHVGGTMVVQPRFSARRFWEVALRHRCTWSSLIPFCVKAVAKLPIPDEHFFRLWVTVVRWPDTEAAFRVETLGLWGMTETITQGIVEDVDEPGPFMCIGRASPGYEIAILDDQGKWIRPGQIGRLFIRGTRGVTLFKEYYKNPEATEKAFDDDGWFDTGDLIQMGENGMLFFRDRDKDMLKVGAENVAASEIEAVIMETGWIDECAVVGQRHDMLDEVPVVFVIPLPDAPMDLESEVINACREKLPDFKVVRAVHVVDELPRSTLEKIAKNELRERLPEIVTAGAA